MDVDDFVEQVRRRAGLAARWHAVRATRATLQTLADYRAQGEAARIAAYFSPDLRTCLTTTEPPEEQLLGEFFAAIGRREGVGLADAMNHARAVMEVLGEAVLQRMDERSRWYAVPLTLDDLWTTTSDDSRQKDATVSCRTQSSRN